MRFLFIRGTLNPENGGPVAALSCLTSALQDFGHSCEMVTLDAPHSPGLDDFPVVVHALGPSLGTYSFNTRLVEWLKKNARYFDIVIVSGIWRYVSFAVWLASRKIQFPYVVFIHGALDPWFKRTYPLKHIKKWFYWTGVEHRVLRDASAVLFTSEEEKILAAQSFYPYRVNEVVVNYGIGLSQGNPDIQRQAFWNAFPLLQGKRCFLFLSRIHAKKGCDMLIEAFAKIASQYPDLYLVMAGPDQEGWQSSLIERAAYLGVNERIVWAGMLTGDIKWGAFHTAEAFVLPSHSENFGVVVVEALACKLPVLITDKVNIWREIKDANAGFVESDTHDGIVRLLEEWLLLPQDARQQMSVNAQTCFLNRFEITMVARTFIETMQTFVKDKAQ